MMGVGAFMAEASIGLPPHTRHVEIFLFPIHLQQKFEAIIGVDGCLAIIMAGTRLLRQLDIAVERSLQHIEILVYGRF